MVNSIHISAVCVCVWLSFWTICSILHISFRINFSDINAKTRVMKLKIGTENLDNALFVYMKNVDTAGCTAWIYGLLGSWVRIPAWRMTRLLWLLSGRSFCNGPITRLGETYHVRCVQLYVIEKPHRRGLGPLRPSCHKNTKNVQLLTLFLLSMLSSSLLLRINKQIKSITRVNFNLGSYNCIHRKQTSPAYFVLCWNNNPLWEL